MVSAGPGTNHEENLESMSPTGDIIGLTSVGFLVGSVRSDKIVQRRTKVTNNWNPYRYGLNVYLNIT